MGPDLGQAITTADRLIHRIGRLPLTGQEVARFLKVPVVDLHGKGILPQDGGVTVYSRDDKETRILVNSGPSPGARLNWTIGHEIGHIVLRHFGQTIQLTRCQAAAFDAEADAFAAELLLPASLILVKGWSDREIAWRCGVSLAAARWRLRQLQNRTVDEACADLVGLWGRRPVRVTPSRRETVADGWLLPGAAPISGAAARAYMDMIQEEESLWRLAADDAAE